MYKSLLNTIFILVYYEILFDAVMYLDIILYFYTFMLQNVLHFTCIIIITV
jgi:hypothetical protein